MVLKFAFFLSLLAKFCQANLYDASFTVTVPVSSFSSDSKGCTVLSNDDVVVGGSTSGVLGSSSFGGLDFFIQRYTSSGSLIWTWQIGGTADDKLTNIASDSADNIYAVGTCGGNFDGITLASYVNNVCITKRDPSGNKLFSKLLGGNGEDIGTGLAVDNANNLFYVAGYTTSSALNGFTFMGPDYDTFITKFSTTNGNVGSHYQHNKKKFTAVVLDSSGNTAMVGGCCESSSTHYFSLLVKKTTPSNGPIFHINAGSSAYSEYGLGAATDSSNAVYAVGYKQTGSIQYAKVTKFSSAGTNLWEFFSTDTSDTAICAAVDSQNNVLYVAGQGKPPGSSIFQPRLWILNAISGALISTPPFSATGSGSFNAIHTAPGGSVFLTGTFTGSFQGQSVSAGSPSNAFLLKLEGFPTTFSPNRLPTLNPTSTASQSASAVPSAVPSADPSAAPTVDPTVAPSVTPTARPSAVPSADPSAAPTVDPTVAPSVTPTARPSAVPSADPSAAPTLDPTVAPSVTPTVSPSAVPSADPSAAPTADPTAIPTAAPTRVCLQWTLGIEGQSCSTTCASVSRVCKNSYLRDIVTAEAFYAMVAGAVNVRTGDFIGSFEALCSYGANDLGGSVGVPSFLPVVYTAESGSPVRGSCSYPTSLADLSGCDAVPTGLPFRQFCPCVDYDCDGSWLLGYVGESCDSTCASGGKVCEGDPLSQVLTPEAFSDMVATAIDVSSSEAIGLNASTFCNHGISSDFGFAAAPAALVTYGYSESNMTFCTYPTLPSEELEASCDVAYRFARRFCNCRRSVSSDFGARKLQLVELAGQPDVLEQDVIAPSSLRQVGTGHKSEGSYWIKNVADALGFV
jgi:hypothetical protein